MDPSQKVTFIKDWISNYVSSMPKKAESLVIGISGGIDSSVSSTLSAMTGLKTIVLSMPIKQKSAQHDLSLKHQEWLKQNFENVEGITVELDSLFSTFQNTLKNFNSLHGMANSRARLRMTTLYQVAAANNGIVVGTGNKVEDFGVGFYTKYGDGAEIIFPEALKNEKEFELVRKSLDCYLLANMTEFGKSKLLNYKQLQDLGYNIVIYPVSTQRLAMKNVEDGLRAIFADGHQNNIIDKMQTRKRLYDLVEYEKYNALDEKIYNFNTDGHE